MDGVASAVTFVASPSVVTSHAGPAAALPRPTGAATGFGATSSVVTKTVGLTAAIGTLVAAGRRARRQQRQARGARGDRPRHTPAAPREPGRQQKVMARFCKGREDVTADEEDRVVAPECLGRDLVEEADSTGGKNRREAVANALAFLGFSWRKHPEAREPEDNRDASLGCALICDGL
eukprot:TRINITY_DN1381_c0_g1_i3.p2 TRINITY_DN1381_c0_g1~~TRINITY_DN1381_c0_g1_i3.p2  ORF type:complete len:178 (+),score=26.86 TRINITY_DN1381_c0_g1_i3:81-614(+)